MKKVIFSIVIFSMGVIGFCSCSDEENDNVLANQEEAIALSAQTSTNTVDEFFTGMEIHFNFFPDTYMIFSLTAPNTVEYTFTTQNTELGKKIQKRFLEKMSNYSGDYDGYSKWAKAEMDKGNIVVGGFNKNTGKHEGNSYTKLEWVILNTPLH
jgi:hypothetical protein